MRPRGGRTAALPARILWVRLGGALRACPHVLLC
nr:MAG TPA: hypothetical protein [Caudoviricetes sp.]